MLGFGRNGLDRYGGGSVVQVCRRWVIYLDQLGFLRLATFDLGMRVSAGFST